MQEMYSIENVEEIIGYDEYIKDFEEQAGSAGGVRSESRR